MLQFIGYILADTNKSVLFQDHFWHSPEWMPKSQIVLMPDTFSNETSIQASQFICGAKQLSEFEEKFDAEGN